MQGHHSRYTTSYPVTLQTGGTRSILFVNMHNSHVKAKVNWYTSNMKGLKLEFDMFTPSRLVVHD